MTEPLLLERIEQWAEVGHVPCKPIKAAHDHPRGPTGGLAYPSPPPAASQSPMYTSSMSAVTPKAIIERACREFRVVPTRDNGIAAILSTLFAARMIP